MLMKGARFSLHSPLLQMHDDDDDDDDDDSKDDSREDSKQQ